MYKLNPLLLVCLLSLLSCSNLKRVTTQHPVSEPKDIRFLSEFDIPYALQYKATTVGGLSGIDYDSVNNSYYFICDDRSDINPARFYKAKIVISNFKIDSIDFTDAVFMQQQDKSVYPNKKTDRLHTPDPEAIRYNPILNDLVWSSEGERIVTTKDTVLANPLINSITPQGAYKKPFTLPSNLIMHAEEKGPRQNGVLEGMSFADNYKTLYANVEEPLYEDGPRADIMENDAFIRIFKFDVATKVNIAQFAYKLDPVAYNANPLNAFKINGVPDILWLGNNKCLVIERSFSTGRQPCTIKVFIADFQSATDIKEISSLKADKNFVPAAKKLLLNMDDLGIYIDNVEGLTFGPDLPNGHKTLLFVADNNFNAAEKSQLLLFEVME